MLEYIPLLADLLPRKNLSKLEHDCGTSGRDQPMSDTPKTTQNSCQIDFRLNTLMYICQTVSRRLEGTEMRTE